MVKKTGAKKGKITSRTTKSSTKAQKPLFQDDEVEETVDEQVDEPIIEAQVPEVSPIDRIKESFTKGLKEGRSSFLKKLFKVKGINSWEVQNLYSSGLMEPEILRDISIGDLVKLTGIGVGLARKVKSILDRDESDLPFEYEKLEIEKIKKETGKVKNDNEILRLEIGLLDKKYHSISKKYDSGLMKNKRYKEEINKLEELEKNSYFKEKRIQDEVMFLIKEQKAFKDRIESIKVGLDSSEAKLQTANRELIFTKGECNHILEKINYLVLKLEHSIKLKDVSHTKLEGFLSELRCIHDTLVDASKRTNVKYYAKGTS